MRAKPASGSLTCPGCGAGQPPSERFCPACGLPLVASGRPPSATLDERQRRARMIKPQLAEGPLVRVAGARNQAEAEFLQQLLLQAGVPSVLRRSAGFDVPDFLAAGPRDVLVAASGLDTAREVLLEAEIIQPRPMTSTVSPARLLAGLIAALVLGAAIISAILALTG